MFVDISDPKSIQKAIQELKARQLMYTTGFEVFLNLVVEEIEEKYLKKLREKLKKYPLPPNRMVKFDWGSEKQHDYIMMLWRKHKIKLPYARTEDIRNKWVIKASVKKDMTGYSIVVDANNTSNHAIFVVGKVGMSKRASDIREYEKPIQPAMRQRWIPAHRIIRPTMLKVQQYVAIRLQQWTGEIMGSE